MTGDRLDSERLRRLLAAGRGLVAELDVDAVLASLLEAARELTGAQYAAIGVLDERRERVERFVTAGIDDETRAAIGARPRGRGILGLLIEDPRPLRLARLGDHPRSYGFPSAHPPMTTFLGAPIVIRGRAWGNLYLTEKAGGAFDDADEEAAVVLAQWAAAAIENARLYRAEHHRRDELERVVRTLEATTEIANAVGGETRLDRVLELTVKRGRALVEARGLLVLLVRGDELEVVAMAGHLDRTDLGQRIPIAGSTSGRVLRAGRPERVPDVRSALRFSLAGSSGASAALLVPLEFHRRSIGLLVAFDRTADGPSFTAEDEQLLAAFGSAAATALATAQDVAKESLRRSIDAAESERSRWARELHDETLQELAAVKLRLAGAARSGDPERLREAAAAAAADLDGSIATLRSLITELRPAALDELGPAAAIEALLDRIRSRTDATIETEVALAYEDERAARRHDTLVESAVYRTVQEAVTNAVKHAGASHITVSVTEDEAAITIVVGDDGRGFAPDGATPGFGLIGMRERLALVGGHLTIDAAPGAGTTLRAAIPTARRAGDEEDLADVRSG